MTGFINSLERNGIAPPLNGSKKTQCPECSDFRVKRDQKCLSVMLDDDHGLVSWFCFHCGWDGCDVLT